MATTIVNAPIMTKKIFLAWFNDPLTKVKDLTDNYQLPDGTPLSKKGVEALCVQAGVTLEDKPKNVKKVYVPVFADEITDVVDTLVVEEENQLV